MSPEITSEPPVASDKIDQQMLDADGATDLQLLNDIEQYDPSKLDDKVLRDDFRLLAAHYSTLKEGGKAGYSLETILNTAKLVYQELLKRGTKFHPDNMKPHAKELFDIISKADVAALSENTPEIDVTAAVNSFDTFKLMTECISIVGSSAHKLSGEDVSPHDIDILIMIPNAPDYMKRGTEARLRYMLPEDVRDKAHFIWEPQAGPHDSYIPLYDMVFERIMPAKFIKMSEQELVMGSDITLMRPFRPMKSTAIEGSTLFYDINELLNKLKDTEGKWLVEKKYDGYHVIIQRKGEDVKIFSEESNDLTIAFPTIAKEALELTTSDFIIEGELVPYYKGKSVGRSTLAKFIGVVKTGKQISDDDIILHAWDIVYLERSIDAEPIMKRKSMLRNLKFTQHIKYVPAAITESAGLKPAIEYAARQPDSEGAMVKHASAPYKVARSSDIIKYRKVHNINVVVLKKNQTESTAWNFDVGILIAPDEVSHIMPEFIVTAGNKKILDLHNTFNTAHIDAAPGDILHLAVQEVWRHRKDGKIRYSLHKPRIIEKATTPATSISELDKFVVGRGLEISNAATPQKSDSEGGAKSVITDFPKRMIYNFRDTMKLPMWLPYVIHAHGRGHSYHLDFRHLTPAGYLEGITVDTPGNDTQPIGFNEQADGLRCELKAIQPKEWLTYEGMHGAGGVGATKYNPAVFFIISKGKYRVLVAEDHRIIIEYKGDQGSVDEALVKKAKDAGLPVSAHLPTKLIQPHGFWLFQIAHIGDNHIILLKHLEHFDKTKIDNIENSGRWVSDPDSWYTQKEKEAIEKFGGIPMAKKPGPDGVINGRPVEVKSVKKDDRYHIIKSIHDGLLADGGYYIFIDANNNSKLMEAKAVEAMLEGPWLVDRTYPHKFLNVKQIFNQNATQEDPKPGTN